MSTSDSKRDERAERAGRQQREREGNRPWGRAAATIEYPGRQREETKTRFIHVGTVWETENGNLKLVLECEPNQWRDPHYRRVVIISKLETRNDA